MLGIRTEAEQSNVPLVLNRKIVGMPAWAIVRRGWKPPLAVISMICVPSTMVTFCFAAGESSERAVRNTVPPMSPAAKMMVTSMAFMG